MATVTIKKADGSSGGSVELSQTIFGKPVDGNLMHLAVRVETINSRQDTRDTKTRGEVAGGGRKPYRQKGTGRARQGSIIAPHYRHGGIALGPHQRDTSAKMPRKARRAAILSALSAKAAGEAIVVLDSLSFDAISTKRAAGVLKSLGLSGRTLIVVPENDTTLYKSFRNIPNVEMRVAPAFSARDILAAERVVFVQKALETLDTVWGATKEAEAK